MDNPFSGTGYIAGCPCTRDCKDRSAGCHGKCEKYQAFTVRVEKIRKDRLLSNQCEPYLPRKEVERRYDRTYAQRRKYRK